VAAGGERSRSTLGADPRHTAVVSILDVGEVPAIGPRPELRKTISPSMELASPLAIGLHQPDLPVLGAHRQISLFCVSAFCALSTQKDHCEPSGILPPRSLLDEFLGVPPIREISQMLSFPRSCIQVANSEFHQKPASRLRVESARQGDGVSLSGVDLPEEEMSGIREGKYFSVRRNHSSCDWILRRHWPSTAFADHSGSRMRGGRMPPQ